MEVAVAGSVAMTSLS